MKQYNILDLESDISSEELINAIKNNHKISTMMKKDIEMLKSKQENKQKVPNLLLPKTEKEEASDSCLNLEEAEYLGKMIESLTDEQITYENFSAILKDKTDDPDYNNLLLSLKLRLLKNIKDISDFCDEEALDKEDLIELKNEMELNKKKIEFLSNEYQEDNSESFQEDMNNLIFVPTTGGSIRILEEFDSIDMEYFNDFQRLFKSIKNNTFLGYRRFLSTNSRINKIAEVRKYKARVVFDRIGPNYYAVITSFVKKCSVDKGYVEGLSNKIMLYTEQRKQLINGLSDKKFLETNKLYENILFDRLNGSNTKSKIYRGSK